MNLSDFDYELPAGSIAQRPLAERDASRMLLLNRATGAWEDRQFRELPALLQGDELLVLNDARVLPARLFGHRAGLRAEATQRQRVLCEMNFSRRLSKCCWFVSLHRTRGKRLCGRDAKFLWASELCLAKANCRPRGSSRRTTACECCGSSRRTASTTTLNRLGHIPLPPYIKRADEPLDRERYQTVYARRETR